MSRPERLDAQAIEARRAHVPEWTYVPAAGDAAERLERHFRFADFVEAFAFVTRVALAAEKHDHHPEWSNVYRDVTVAWTTHSAGGVTELDFRLARRCDELAGS